MADMYSHKVFNHKPIRWEKHDKLTSSKDYNEWASDKGPWGQNTCQHHAVVNRKDLSNIVMWAGLDSTLQEQLRMKIKLTQDDLSLSGQQVIHELFAKVGSAEWLQFNLQKMCSRSKDSARDKPLQVLFNASVSPDGTNAKFVLGKLIWATEKTATDPDGAPWRMCCNQVVRAFSTCTIDNINVAVRTRKVSRLASNLGTAQSFIDFDILDEARDQGDRDTVTHRIDWQQRWAFLKEHATSLVETLSVRVRQTHVNEDLAPVYIKGWKAFDILGQNPDLPSGPTPPKSRQQYSPHSDRDHSRSRSPYKRNLTKPSPSAQDEHPHDPYQKHAPTFEQYNYWYKHKTMRCLACGGCKRTTGHSNMHKCTIKSKYFPDFVPDWKRLKPDQQLNATDAAPAAQQALGSRYQHRDDSDRGRSASRDSRQSRQQDRGRSRERRDDRGRGRDRERDRSKSRPPTDRRNDDKQPDSGKE